VAWRFFTAGGVAKTGEYVELAANAVTSAKILDGTIVNADISASAGITNEKLATPGIVVQMVNTQTSALATGTTTMSAATIPQITDGTQFMTRTITPKNASNILVVQVIAYAASSVSNHVNAALFVGTTVNALAASSHYSTAANIQMPLSFLYRMVADVTSELTFRVRVGGHAASTTSFNGAAGGLHLGTAIKSSMTITEFTP